MPRCCGGSGCSCNIQAGANISITGDGSSGSPFQVSANFGLTVVDNATFNLTLSGAGTVASPYAIEVTYAGTAKLNQIPDVAVTAPTNGQVLAWNTGTGKWTPVAPTTASTGAVTHDTSLTGDGSVGVPLQVLEDPAGFLVTGAAGLGLTDAGKLALVRKFTTTAARTAATPAPTLNSLSELDTAPGRIDYWDGVNWKPVKDQITIPDEVEFLALSGSYTGGPVTQIVRQITLITNADGTFDALTTATLTGFAGVLAVSIQPVGSVPYLHTVTPAVTKVTGMAFAPSTGAAYATQQISMILTAYLY